MQKPKSKISIAEYYERYAEGERLSKGLGRLEFERTKAILARFLPPAPAAIVDVGGGTGPYSLWLARSGYRVHLVDLSPKLVKGAVEASRGQPDTPLASFTVGDARYMSFPNRTADAVLMLGPLYHLLDREDRLLALREAHRILKHKGLLFAAATSRLASFVDGVLTGAMRDPIFAETVANDIKNRRHHNPTDNTACFTDAHSHLPPELKDEIVEAGFRAAEVLPVEGMGALVTNLDEIWRDEHLTKNLLEIVALSEREETILGISPHLLCVAHRAC